MQNLMYTCDKSICQAKENKTNVIIFPEGTRHHSTKEREMLPFKKGAFAAAIGSQMPVLPVVISHYKAGLMDKY